MTTRSRGPFSFVNIGETLFFFYLKLQDRKQLNFDLLALRSGGGGDLRAEFNLICNMTMF